MEGDPLDTRGAVEIKIASDQSLVRPPHAQGKPAFPETHRSVKPTPPNHRAHEIILRGVPHPLKDHPPQKNQKRLLIVNHIEQQSHRSGVKDNPRIPIREGRYLGLHDLLHSPRPAEGHRKQFGLFADAGGKR